MDYDVVVVGAGPTGLTLAGDLAAAGVRTVLLERRSGTSNLTRAFAVHARTMELLDARGLADAWTTSDDVERTKPAPDLLQVALEKLGAPHDAAAVMVGDSVWDVKAADGAGMPALVVRSGGFGDDELNDAGALAIFDTPGDLAANLQETPLA